MGVPFVSAIAKARQAERVDAAKKITAANRVVFFIVPFSYCRSSISAFILSSYAYERVDETYPLACSGRPLSSGVSLPRLSDVCDSAVPRSGTDRTGHRVSSPQMGTVVG